MIIVDTELKQKYETSIKLTPSIIRLWLDLSYKIKNTLKARRTKIFAVKFNLLPTHILHSIPYTRLVLILSHKFLNFFTCKVLNFIKLSSLLDKHLHRQLKLLGKKNVSQRAISSYYNVYFTNYC